MRAARLVDEGAPAARLLQRVELKGRILVVRRNPRIADQHLLSPVVENPNFRDVQFVGLPAAQLCDQVTLVVERRPKQVEHDLVEHGRRLRDVDVFRQVAHLCTSVFEHLGKSVEPLPDRNGDRILRVIIVKRRQNRGPVIVVEWLGHILLPFSQNPSMRAGVSG